MKPTCRALLAGGICLASALTLPGCSTERTARAPLGWTRLWSPFRTAQKPVNEPETALGAPAGSPALPPVPSDGWTPSDPQDGYYSPRGAELAVPLTPAKPPAAPPALEPGFLNDDGETGTHPASGFKSQGNKPARLRDVFDGLGRKQPVESRPKIPLDEPVAVRAPTTMHVVGYELSEPVTLGRPEFAKE